MPLQWFCCSDSKMRRSYSQQLQRFMAEIGSRPVSSILDFGCAIGLSSRELKSSFPGAKVMGLDLSPHFLAVGKALQRNVPKVCYTRWQFKTRSRYIEDIRPNCLLPFQMQGPFKYKNAR